MISRPVPFFVGLHGFGLPYHLHASDALRLIEHAIRDAEESGHGFGDIRVPWQKRYGKLLEAFYKRAA